MAAEQLLAAALQCSTLATATGALVPLQTELITAPSLAPFVLRRLLSRTPKHLRAEGPKPNPFLPWERDLEVARPDPDHVVLLNKYPVQRGHVLLITAGWKPQAGWLEPSDWSALCHVTADTSGLWFFNSCAAAGASQPHRHLQLLPRAAGEAVCPLEPLFETWLSGAGELPRPAWLQTLSRRSHPADPVELEDLYLQHCQQLDLGQPGSDPVPRAPYNLLLCDRWLLTVRRRREHGHGFSINALGYAGYLLVTRHSDLDWLQASGAWALLDEVAEPGPPSDR